MTAPEWFSFFSETSPASWLLLLLVSSALLYWAISARLLARWQQAPTQPPESSLPPVVFFRPVKRGLRRPEAHIRALLACAREGDRVVFGVSTLEDETLCLALCREETPPGVVAKVIRCAPSTPAFNPKVQKLIAMTAETDAMAADAPEHWIVTDSEALPTRPLLDAFRAEWLASGCAAFTAGYRFTPPRSFPELLDRLPLLLTLWPGLMAAHAGSGSRGLGFALGACMALQRSYLQQIGGWKRLLPYLAEDNRLGAFLREQGHATGLSRQIIPLEGDPLSWGAMLRHQHRIAFTYRVCNPWGTLGMIMTHGLPFSLALALLAPSFWSLPFLVALTRVALARRMSRRLGYLHDTPPLRFAVGVIFSGFLESAMWLLAWLPLPVCWNDRSLKADRWGRLLPAGPGSAPAESAPVLR